MKKEETQQVDENLQDTVDKVTKAGQSALERMGVKIIELKEVLQQSQIRTQRLSRIKNKH